MKEDVEHNALVFVLSGEIDISTAGAVCKRVQGRQFFLVCAGDSFHGKAILLHNHIRLYFRQRYVIVQPLFH